MHLMFMICCIFKIKCAIITKLSVNSCCIGIKHEWQVNGLEDIKDRKTLAEKLGGSSVVSLEGKPLND